MSKALTPQEVMEKQSTMITNWLIDVINSRLLAEWNGVQAYIKKAHVVKFIADKGYNPQAFEENGGLKFEHLFRTAGWRVETDKDGWLFEVVKRK
jgi:hypothetical protein